MNTTTPTSQPDRQRDLVVRQFRTHVHLAVTAWQTKNKLKFPALPGPDSLTYCQALAQFPDHVLAGELTEPVDAILEQIYSVARACEWGVRPQPDGARALPAQAEAILGQLDFALEWILQRLLLLVERRSPSPNVTISSATSSMPGRFLTAQKRRTWSGSGIR